MNYRLLNKHRSKSGDGGNRVMYRSKDYYFFLKRKLSTTNSPTVLTDSFSSNFKLKNFTTKNGNCFSMLLLFLFH